MQCKHSLCFVMSFSLFLGVHLSQAIWIKIFRQRLKFLKSLSVCKFYQALWWKVLLKIVSPKCDLGIIVIPFGFFLYHYEFSWLCRLFNDWMTDAGICQVLEVAYPGNTVPHLAIPASNVDTWNKLFMSFQTVYRRKSHSLKNQFQILGRNLYWSRN